MKLRDNSQPIVSVGISFMLVIFIVLCMIVFALLSLSSSLKDYGYSEKSQANITSYYEAVSSAEETLAKLDDVLSAAASKYSKGSSEYVQYVTDQFAGDKTVAITASGSDIEVTILAPAGSSKALQVIATTSGISQGDTYTISSYTKVSTTDWEGDTSLPVLK